MPDPEEDVTHDCIPIARVGRAHLLVEPGACRKVDGAVVLPALVVLDAIDVLPFVIVDGPGPSLPFMSMSKSVLDDGALSVQAYESDLASVVAEQLHPLARVAGRAYVFVVAGVVGIAE